MSHGLSKTSRAYVRWKTMKARCLNPKHESFSRYGAVGIGICKRWMQFENFLADMGEPEDGMFLDRKRNNGNYCPSNCRWVTPKQSTENRNNTVWLLVDGRMLRVNEAARKYRIAQRLVRQRLWLGWTVKEALCQKKIPHGYGRHGALNPRINRNRPALTAGTG